MSSDCVRRSLAKAMLPLEEINFGVTVSFREYLIRRIISPNQDDLSYSSRTFFSEQQKLGKLPNPLSLAGQRCRRLTDGSSIAATAWIHEGTYLIHGFLARNPS